MDGWMNAHIHKYTGLHAQDAKHSICGGVRALCMRKRRW